jgi:lysophospholipase L1-like esterase
LAVSARPAPPREKTPRISARKQALFSLIMLLLVLGAIEASVRVYHAVRNVGSGDPEPRGYVVDDSQAGYSLKPGYTGGGIRINSLGFRGPEISRDKPPGVQRMVALGDSATFGPSEEECAYPFLLPDLLGQRRVEVINAGVEGYRSDRALVHLSRDVLPLRPDVVTVFIGWNDLYQTDPAVESDQLSLRASPLTRLLTLSDAAQTFRRLFFLRFETQRADTQDGPAPVLASYQPAGYAERLREIIDTARGGGARVLVFTWPTILADDMTPQAVAKVHYPPYTNRLADLKALYARYQDTLRQVAAEEQVPVVDNAAVFTGDKAPYFLDTAHFTCQGQAMVARNVADALLATGSVR